MDFKDVFKTWAEQNPTKVEEAISLYIQCIKFYDLSNEQDEKGEDTEAGNNFDEAERLHFQLVELLMGPMYTFLTKHPLGDQLSLTEEHGIWDEILYMVEVYMTEEYINSQKSE